MLKQEEGDGTWDDVTGGVTLTATNHCDFESFLNELYITNGNDLPIKWTGGAAVTATNMTVTANLTKAKYTRLFNNYLFLGNVTVSGVSYPSRIYWSNIKDTSVWDAAAFIEIAKDDGDEITGLRVLSDRLIIYKSRSIYTLYFTGDADIPFILPGGGKTNSNVGCIAPWSIQEVDNGHVFMASDGLYFFDGSNSYKLSDKIRKTLFEDFNFALFSQGVSINYKLKNRYMIAFPYGAEITNSYVIVWDYFNNAFSIYKGLAPSAMAIFYINGNDERPYFSDYNGYDYRMDYGTDDYPLKVQTSVDAYYYTNWKYYDDLCDQKGILSVYVYYQFNSANVTYTYSYDLEESDQYTQSFNTATGADVWDTMLWDVGHWSGSGGKYQRLDIDGRGRLVRFGFKNSAIGETFRIDGIGVFGHLETNV